MKQTIAIITDGIEQCYHRTEYGIRYGQIVVVGFVNEHRMTLRKLK